ncbi:oocyte zinc finger protein XlCOF6-like isoform X2 [Anoplophora glabripennis]|uniref:oocyte zinc finger protein XlCOF6-like isoform X2 n=1 Tax=Anoplophora glabripennis TaxID=217634 RepID=UPI00087389C2|nr:oocyte zinc finger protein XlCOF6-like isoform X2 [Anoplophora glabripennis]
MNSLFNSDENESGRISLNSNNIIIVSEDGTRWSPEYGSDKNTMPLRVVNNVLSTIMGTNSSEVADEEMPLNTRNVMIVSEDSSEWSQKFIAVNENQAPLAAINDTNDTWIEDEKESLKVKKGDGNINYTGSENGLSSVPDPEHFQDKNTKEPPEEFLNSDLLRCRTCLSIVDTEEGIPLYTLEPSGETLRELLIYLLPQMVSTVCDEDVVCKQCNTSIKFCVDFIDNCIRVETELLNEFEEDQEEVDETEVKFRPQEPTHVTLDHDYMVSELVLPQLKTENPTFMETEESGTAGNLLSNDDPTLASADEYLFECFTCAQTFESENALDIHAKAEHGIIKQANRELKQEEKIYYKCNSCEVLFASKSAYNLHVQGSHPEKGVQSAPQGTYTCKQCCNKFFYLGDLFEHKRRVHGFNCTICPERFNAKEDLDAHLETHPDLYSCEICNKAFKTKKSMTSHTKTHISSEMNDCGECGRSFDTFEELNLHLEQDDHSMLTIIKKFICEICDACFTDKKRLNKHKQVYHDYIREYLCTVCDKNFSSKTSLDSHYRLKHANIKPYQCERCGERFARLDYLRRHNSCSDSTQCKKCMKGPRRKFRYTKADGEPIKCKLCGKVFKDVYLLKLHLTTHTNLRRFRCSVCNLTFTTNKNRERHEKIHDDPLSKYRCTVCWKRTQSQEELDSHMLTHEKKYQCHVCHESFARVYLLNYHVSEVHADDEDVEKEKQIVFTEGLKEYLVEY